MEFEKKEIGEEAARIKFKNEFIDSSYSYSKFGNIHNDSKDNHDFFKARKLYCDVFPEKVEKQYYEILEILQSIIQIKNTMDRNNNEDYNEKRNYYISEIQKLINKKDELERFLSMKQSDAYYIRKPEILKEISELQKQLSEIYMRLSATVEKYNDITHDYTELEGLLKTGTDTLNSLSKKLKERLQYPDILNNRIDNMGIRDYALSELERNFDEKDIGIFKSIIDFMKTLYKKSVEKSYEILEKLENSDLDFKNDVFFDFLASDQLLFEVLEDLIPSELNYRFRNGEQDVKNNQSAIYMHSDDMNKILNILKSIIDETYIYDEQLVEELKMNNDLFIHRIVDPLTSFIYRHKEDFKNDYSFK